MKIQKHGKERVNSINEDTEKLFKEAKRMKPKLHLTAKQIDELNENASDN